MVQRRIELINGVRTERVAYLGPIKSDPHDRGVISPVIGDVGEVKAIHRMPQLRRERASHALKLTVTRFERRSRAADDRRNDEQRAIRKLSNPASTVARCKSDDDVSFQRDVREKRQKNWRVQVIPLRHAGPRLTNTLHAPRR